MTLVNRIRQLAARPQGMCSNDIETHSTSSVGCACIKLMQRGDLHRVKLAHKNVRWFADKAKADALQTKVDRGTVFTTPRALEGYRGHVASWPADAVAVETPATVYTKCPRFVPRFQEHTFSFIHGGLRAA